MKYGKTERISGIVILLALLAIVVPWLLSDPAPREERPQPTFVIEQPVDVVRQDVPVPQVPESLDSQAPSTPVVVDKALDEPIDAMPRAPQTDQVATSSSSSSSSNSADEPVSQAPAETSSEPASPPQEDPIAALVAANESRNSGSAAPATQQQGEWAVQVGSFGDTANAQRISDQLSGEGFSVFQRARDNNLTTVLVGPYATAEDGEAAMSLIKQRINVQGLLVRVRD